MRNPAGNAAELSYGLVNGACPPCDGIEPMAAAGAGVKFIGINALAEARISPREFTSEAKFSGPKGKAA